MSHKIGGKLSEGKKRYEEMLRKIKCPLTTYKLAKRKGRGGRGNTNEKKEKKLNQIVKIF